MSFDRIKTATAFWSYAHSDDEGSDGQIRRLKERLDHAFKLHRGEALASFFDRTGDHKIEWGEEWRSKIRTSISGTTFFIPIISPSYVKSSMCRQEFDEFVEKAASSDLNELILPILWVPVEPETDEEQRIYDAASARQWVDWTALRKQDESSPPYRALVDQMGERLAKAARSVSKKPELGAAETALGAANPQDDAGDSPASGAGAPVAVGDIESAVDDPPGLLELGNEAVSKAESLAANLTSGFSALNDLVKNVLQPNPLNPQANTGQRNFYFKHIASEMSPYAQQFEASVKAAEADALDLNNTMYEVIEILQMPGMSGVVRVPSIDKLRELPNELTAKFGDYGSFRGQLSSLGRMSRDLRQPFSAFERGFDSMDEIIALVRDWTTAMEALGEEPPNPLFNTPARPKA